MANLNGRLVQIFQGSGYQICTIEAGRGGLLPFRARSQRSGFNVSFSAKIAKQLHRGTATNMKLM